MSDLVVFDKAKWHFEGDFPDDLAAKQAFVHTGMYLGWVIDQELYSEEFAEDFDAEIQEFKARKMTGPSVYRASDGVFEEGMLSAEGLAFTTSYFDLEQGRCMADYEALLAVNLPTMYHVQDTWHNYDLLKPQIDQRFAAWRKKPRKK